MMGSGLGFKNVSMYEPSQMSSNFKKKKTNMTQSQARISVEGIMGIHHMYSTESFH